MRCWGGQAPNYLRRGYFMHALRRRPLGFFSVFLILVSLVFAGCSSSDGANTGGQNFVFTGGQNANTGALAPGALTFNFVKAQAPLTVPNDTTQIKFRFFASGNVLIQQEIRDFAASITIDPVDARTSTVEVVALGSDGSPVATATVPVQVISGEDVAVDFSGITVTLITLDALVVSPPSAAIEVGSTVQLTATLQYSNGDLLPADNVTWSATGQATVSTTGLVTGTVDGESVITADRNGLMDTATVVVGQGLFLSGVEILPNVTPNVETNVGSLQLTVQGVDQFNNPIAVTGTPTWAITTNNSGSSIEQNGLFSGGPTEGLDTVTVTVGALSDTQTVNVVDIPGDITSVTTTPNPTNLTAPGQRQALTTVGSFENGPDATLTNIDNGLTYASDNTAVATVTATGGVVTAVAQGTANITAMAGGQMDSVVVNVNFGANNQAPVITPDAGVLTLDQTAVPAYPGVTVTDDQVSLDTGMLTLSVTGNANDLLFDVDETTTIGTVMNDNTSTVTVTLNTTATPANVQTFLQGVTVRRNALSGTATMQISLNDGHPTNPATGMATRAANAVITVGTMEDFTTIASALVGVNNTNATILVEAGHTDPIGAISIDNGVNANLDGLTILGAAAGQSAGVVPDPMRVDPGTIQDFLVVAAINVTLDGLDFDEGMGATAGSNNLVIRNCLFTESPMSFVSIGIECIGAPGLILADCRFTDWSLAGVVLQGDMVTPFPGGTITGCAFVNNNTGILTDPIDGTQVISGNGFANSGNRHVSIRANTGVTVTITGNEFKDDSGVVTADTTGNLDAQFNYWGAGIDPTNPTNFTTTGTATINTDNHLTVDPFPGF
jgi:uncharacterized protein YcfL